MGEEREGREEVNNWRRGREEREGEKNERRGEDSQF